LWGTVSNGQLFIVDGFGKSGRVRARLLSDRRCKPQILGEEDAFMSVYDTS
jgi:hypothetical protein